jgi:hypothetical protein
MSTPTPDPTHPIWTKVGITGAQRGITPEARASLIMALQEVKAEEVHHGDCVGADASAHAEALKLGLRVVLHPPIQDAFRAFCAGHSRTVTILPPLAYTVRNRKIVDGTDGLIALPATKEEQLRSGTWSTYRYARGVNKSAGARANPPKPTLLIYPDGTREYSGHGAPPPGPPAWLG